MFDLHIIMTDSNFRGKIEVSCILLTFTTLFKQCREFTSIVDELGSIFRSLSTSDSNILLRIIPFYQKCVELDFKLVLFGQSLNCSCTFL